MRREQKAIVQSLLVAILCVGAPGLRAQPAGSGEAEAAFNAGKQHYHDKDYTAAAAAFRRAHALRPNWKLLYNIGQSEAAAKRYGLAVEAFERYLVLGGDDIGPDRQVEVLAEIDKFRKIVGAIEISSAAGLTVFVDDLERGTTPLAGPLLVAAGIEHRLVARRDDEPVFEQAVRVIGGQSTTIEVEVEVEPAASERAPSETPEIRTVPNSEAGPLEHRMVSDDRPPAKKPLKTAGWVVAGAGAGVLVAGAVTGGLALSLDKDLKTACNGGCPPDKQPDRDRMERLALATDVLISVGAGVAAAGIAMVLIGNTKGETKQKVSVLPHVSSGLAAISITHEF